MTDCVLGGLRGHIENFTFLLVSCIAGVFGCVCCWVLVFVLSPFCLDLYVLGEDTWMGWGSSMRSRRLAC